MSNIVETLSEIQSELKAPKGQYNQFGKYKYRSCEDILEALKPILSKHKAAIQISDTIVPISGRIYVKSTAILHVGDDVVQNTAYAREDESKKGMDGAQITGAASSYARKYALNGLFAIDDTKDPDATNDHGKSETGSELPEPTSGTDKPSAGNICSNCGKEITDTVKRDGTLWTVYDIREYSIMRFGRSLCPACMKAAQKAEKEAKKATDNGSSNQ